MSTNMQQIKDNALRFCTSERTSDASNIIGFSIILFAIFEVIDQDFEKRIPFRPYNVVLTCDSLRYFIIFLILSIIIGIIFFIGMHFVYCGRITREIIYYEGDVVTSLREFFKAINVTTHGEKFWGILPCRLFSSGISKPSKGLLISFLFGLIASFTLMWTFLFC